MSIREEEEGGDKGEREVDGDGGLVNARAAY